MTRQVVVELVDFKIKEHQHSVPNELSSSDHENHHLINLLKKGLALKFMKFSLNFLPIGNLDHSKSDYCYDVVLSDDYDKLITSEGSKLSVYNRSTSAETFDSKPLFKVTYSDSFRCLKLIKGVGGEYIYASTVTDNIVKIRVSDLMTKKSKLVWKSKIFSNVWGLDILKENVYTIQYSPATIVVLDCETGQTLSNEYLPHVSNGYGIHFFSEKEMLISHSKHLELFEQQDELKWVSIRKSSFIMSTAYSIFYEELSNLIYVADSSSKQVFIVRREDFSVVKTISSSLKMNFGMMVDKRSGLMYLCDTVGYSVVVYK